MIDCVFQLMIFFIVTFKLDNDLIDEKIKLAKSPNGPAIEKKAPGTLIVEVDRKGTIKSGATVYPNKETLRGVVISMANRIGANNVYVLIRADKDTEHYYVRQVMDRCTEAGVWKIRFAAMKHKGE
mgnify:CR=1 FL=1